MMQYRWPDDPIQIPPHALYQLLKEEPGTRVAQFKWDGWRKPAYFEKDVWTLHSKRNEQKQPPPAELMAQFRTWKVPEGTALDMEWMGPRAVAELAGRHWFKVFDITWLKDEWLGKVGFVRRHKMLQELFQHTPPPACVEFTDICGTRLMDLFEQSKTLWMTEGIVVKHKDSGLVGDLFRPTDNPLWNKVKWRA
jgi:ATP-dependent DNA ligase